MEQMSLNLDQQSKKSEDDSQKSVEAEAEVSSEVQENPSKAQAGEAVAPNQAQVTEESETEDEVCEKADEPHVYSVSEINRCIRNSLEDEFRLIWIRGEISNFKAHSSGHFYFSLKDKKAQVNAVMFRGFNGRLKFRPESGMEVLIRGKVTVYEPRGNYQIFCELMEPVGAGALQMAFEQLKAKLQKEGLFDASRKRPLPALPKHVAVVTSPTGAAIRDILNVLGRRFKGLQVTVIPALVQGDQAPQSIVLGIEQANKLKDVDALIVGRGGGSMEDLWGFNDETVARAIAGSKVPVISAVGHEVDFTIADFVADLRAPTPSAAAELVVKNAAELMEKVDSVRRQLVRNMVHCVQLKRQKLEQCTKRLVDPQRKLQDLAMRCDELRLRLEGAVHRALRDRRVQVELMLRKMGSPKEQVASARHRVDVLSSQLKTCMERSIENRQAQVARLASLLDSLSPLKVVERGYAIASKDKKVVKEASALNKGDRLSLRFARGEADVEVIETRTEPTEMKEGESHGL